MKWTNLLIAACAVLLFVLLFPSKSSAFDWGSYRLNSDNNAVAFDTKHFNNEAVAAPITLDLGNPSTMIRPVAGDGLLFIQTGSIPSQLKAVRLSTGETVWTKQYATQITKLYFYNHYLYISSNFFAKIDPANGNELFKTTKDKFNKNLPVSEIHQIYKDKIYAVKNIVSPQYLIVLSIDGQILHESSNSISEYVPNILVNESGFYVVRQSWNTNSTRVEAYNNLYSSLWVSNSCNAKAGSATLDTANNSIHLVAFSNRACGYDATTGQQNYTKFDSVARYFVKYGDVIHGVFDYYSTHFDAKDKTATISSELVLKYSDKDGKFSSSPIIFNGVLYAGTDTGKIYGRNLETGTENKWVIGGNTIDNIFYSDGKFIIQETSGSSKKIYIYDVDGLNLQPNNFVIKLNSPYKAGNFNQYLGQTHCHYIPDVNWMKLYRNDIPIIPADTVLKYKDAGYDFVALTEHNKIVPMPVVEGILQIQNAEEDTQGSGGNHILALGIQSPIDEMKSNKERIKQVEDQGGIPIFAHISSNSYSMPLSELASSWPEVGLEIYNNAVNKWSLFAGESIGLEKFDVLLSRRYAYHAFAGDDYTPGNGGFDGGAIMVLSESIDQSDILSNIKDGNFYAVQGSTAPRMNITTGEGSISVSTNKKAQIRFVGNQGKVLQRVEDVSSASYIVDGTEVYVRIEVEADGKTSWSQPIFVDKISTQSTSTSGEHIASLGKANIKSNSSSILKGEVLSQTGLPPKPPEMGYVGPAYAVTPESNIPGSSISMDYSQDKNGVDTGNLDACGYNSETGKWELLNAENDIARQTVTAPLSDYEAYTVCQNPINDEMGPSISLVSPLELNNISGIVDFAFSVNDPAGVSTVKFNLDGVEYPLTLHDDGYYHAAIDFNTFPASNHIIIVFAEDNFGNITEKNFEINSSSNYIIPKISLDSPTESKHYAGNLYILGNVKNYGEQNKVSILIDNVYIKDLSLIDGKFSDDLNIANFADGQHEFEVRFIDQFGNAIKKKVNIFFGLKNEPTENTPTNLDDNHEEIAATSDGGTADKESMSGPIVQPPKKTTSEKSLPETVSSILLTEKSSAENNDKRKLKNGRILGVDSSNVAGLSYKYYYIAEFKRVFPYAALAIFVLTFLGLVYAKAYRKKNYEKNSKKDR